MRFKRAHNALLAYLRTNSDGGTRADLIDEIVLAGLKRPVANTYLDAVLGELSRLGIARGAAYADFKALVTRLDTADLRDTLGLAIGMLSRAGRPITTMRRAVELEDLTTQRDQVQTLATNLTNAVAAMQANLPDGSAKTDAITSLTIAASNHQASADELQEQIERLGG
jgi:hypothetical protein